MKEIDKRSISITKILPGNKTWSLWTDFSQSKGKLYYEQKGDIIKTLSRKVFDKKLEEIEAYVEQDF